MRWTRITAILLLSACSTDVVSGARAPLDPHIIPNLSRDEIATWGDSLTDGGSSPLNYPSQLSELLYRSVFNGGVSGQTSTQILDRYLADAEHAADVEVFWMGRNNFEDPTRVKADIAAAVAHMRRIDRHFVVMSILNGNYPDELAGTLKYSEIMQLNADLASLYPDNFIDVRAMLVGKSDVPPDSLRADELHLDAAGNRVVAEAVAAFVNARKW